MSTLGQNYSTCFQENYFQVLSGKWAVLKLLQIDPKHLIQMPRLFFFQASQSFSYLYLFVTQTHFNRKNKCKIIKHS